MDDNYNPIHLDLFARVNCKWESGQAIGLTDTIIKYLTSMSLSLIKKTLCCHFPLNNTPYMLSCLHIKKFFSWVFSENGEARGRAVVKECMDGWSPSSV